MRAMFEEWKVSENMCFNYQTVRSGSGMYLHLLYETFFTTEHRINSPRTNLSGLLHYN